MQWNRGEFSSPIIHNNFHNKKMLNEPITKSLSCQFGINAFGSNETINKRKQIMEKYIQYPVI